MPKVVGLDGAAVAPEVDYDAGLVDLLERGISEIKRGKICGIGLITIRKLAPDSETNLDIETSYQGGRLVLIAGAARLMHHLNTDQDNEHASQGT
jgi:hypothetical protein